MLLFAKLLPMNHNIAESISRMNFIVQNLGSEFLFPFSFYHFLLQGHVLSLILYVFYSHIHLFQSLDSISVYFFLSGGGGGCPRDGTVVPGFGSQLIYHFKQLTFLFLLIGKSLTAMHTLRINEWCLYSYIFKISIMYVKLPIRKMAGAWGRGKSSSTCLTWDNYNSITRNKKIKPNSKGNVDLSYQIPIYVI